MLRGMPRGMPAALLWMLMVEAKREGLLGWLLRVLNSAQWGLIELNVHHPACCLLLLARNTDQGPACFGKDGDKGKD